MNPSFKLIWNWYAKNVGSMKLIKLTASPLASVGYTNFNTCTSWMNVYSPRPAWKATLMDTALLFQTIYLSMYIMYL